MKPGAKEVKKQIYLQVEDLLVPVCQLVPQGLNLSSGWIQFRVQRSDNLQVGQERQEAETLTILKRDSGIDTK